MLRITKAEEQAVRLVMRLATADSLQTLGELAESEEITEPTVAKLLASLRRGGVVDAVRGRNGGYVLAREPARISTAQVIRAVGSEPMQEQACVAAGETYDGCPRSDDCGLRSVWRHLHLQVTTLLESTSVADLLEMEAEVDRHVCRVWPLQLESTAGG
jgi:Rrf2 family protein